MKFIPGQDCWDVGSVTQTGLLIDACDYYRAFYEAAKTAQRYILISGWEFDSDVELLRGNEAQGGDEVRFLSFINNLCESRPELEIYILAWDFTYLYMLDREWFQSWYFNWTTNERLHFCFDALHAFGASHHQKFVVVDGVVGFVGGLDICSSRWDERDHRTGNPLRVNSDKVPYRAFHDVQSYHLGPLAEKLAKMFKLRWEKVGGAELQIPGIAAPKQFDFRCALPIAAREVAISRTQAKTSDNDADSCQEIRCLFLKAVEAAESLIYIENQYFSTTAVYNALVNRMRAPDRGRLEIILILSKEADAFLEQVSIGILQAKAIRTLKEVASQTGHSLSVFYPATRREDGHEAPTYIHSKLLLIDDRFLSVGSANFNNRSMGLDTEVNVSWHAGADDREFIRSIRRVRVSLLAEHARVRKLAEVRRLSRVRGLVNFLNEIANDPSLGLRHHPLESALDEAPSGLLSFFPEGLPFDSEEPFFGYKGDSTGEQEGFFSKGIVSLNNWLSLLQTRSENR